MKYVLVNKFDEIEALAILKAGVANGTIKV